MEAKRQSNIELLRIVLMIMILLFHYYVHGIGTKNDLIFNNLILQSICFGGKIAVNVFVLISGYYLVTSRFSIIRLVKFVVQIKFYDIIILILCFKFNTFPLTNNVLFQSVFPLTSMTWFASVYLVLYLLTPLINLILLRLEKVELIKVILLLFMGFIFLPSIVYYKFYSNELILFVILYSIGAYLRLFCDIRNKIYKYIGGRLTLFGILVCLISIFLMDLLGNIFGFNRGVLHYVSEYSVFAWLTSLGIFLWFQNLNVKDNKYINYVSSTVFGVYLIHDNPLVCKFIWHNLLKVDEFYYSGSGVLLLHCLLSVSVVFIICSLIELLRGVVFNCYLMRIFYNKLNSLQNRIDRIIDCIVSKLVLIKI